MLRFEICGTLGGEIMQTKYWQQFIDAYYASERSMIIYNINWKIAFYKMTVVWKCCLEKNNTEKMQVREKQSDTY